MSHRLPANRRRKGVRMRTSAWVVGFVGLLLSAQALATDYEHDKNGREFRTSFPLHDRFSVATGISDIDPRPSFSMTLAVYLNLDFPEEEIWWVLRHDLFAAELRFDGNASAGLVEGEYLRHDLSSFIVVPADVDWRVPAPFDLSVDWRFLSVDLVEFEPKTLEPMAMSFSADFCRDEAFRTRCALGVNTAYVYEFGEEEHVITPFSSRSIRLKHETASGRFAVSVQGDGGWKLRTTRTARDWQPGWAVTGDVEWVFLAINDQPLSWVISAGRDAWDESYNVGAALRVSFPTR
jgi:hypothetical protein